MGDESLTVCLGQNNVASCNGDSGGPIFVEVPSSEPAQEQVVRKQEGSGSEVEVRSVADPPSGGTSFVQVGVLSSGEIITTGPSRWSEIFQGPSDWRQDNSVPLLVEGALGNRHLP